MKFRKYLLGGLVVSLCAWGASVAARDGARFTFQENVGRSDLVIIGEAIGVVRPNHYEVYLRVRVVDVLKGHAAPEILILGNPITISDGINCCDDGEVILIVLSRIRGEENKYISVNGNYSLYRIGAKTAAGALR